MADGVTPGDDLSVVTPGGDCGIDI